MAEAAPPRPGTRVSVDQLTVKIPPGHTACRLRKTASPLYSHVEHEEDLRSASLHGPTAGSGMKPLVLTEGRHDRATLETVWGKLYSGTDVPFVVRVADPTVGAGGGGGGAGMLRTMIESFHPDDDRQAVAIFDRDEEGIGEFDRLSKNFRRWQGRDDVKAHDNGLSFAMLLPVPDFRQEFANNNNLPMELLFPDDVTGRTNGKGRGLVLADPVVSVVANNQKISVDTSQLGLPLDGLRKVEGDKKAFATEIVPDTTSQECAAFRPLFETVMALFGVGEPA